MPPTRRAFLGSAALGAAALAAPGLAAAADRDGLSVGVIGCGRRGTELVRELLKLNQRVTALCDVADFRLDAMQELLADAGQDEARTFGDYRRLLDVKSLDAVVIATPDHHHKEQLVAAVAAKKHAYVETPMTKSIDEGAEMIDAVRKAGKVVQVGHQRHSGPHWDDAARAVRAWAFGKLVWAKVWDCRHWVKTDPLAVPAKFKYDPLTLDWEAFLGAAAKRPFDAHRYFAWRWYWDYAGGLMADVGAQQLDLVSWIGGVEVPKGVVANGGRYLFDKWETPDVVHGAWDYGKFAANFAVEFINGADGAGAAFYGTKQTLVCDSAKEIRLYDTVGPIAADTKPAQTWKIEDETPAHVANWIDCIQSGEEPAAPVELGHRVALAAHLANLSYRTGKKIFWDADRNEIIGS